MSARKCPKCRSTLLWFAECWLGRIGFEQAEDGKLYTYWGNKDNGDPTSVEAKCEACGHGWRVPGAQQITDIGEVVVSDTGRPVHAALRGAK